MLFYINYVECINNYNKRYFTESNVIRKYCRFTPETYMWYNEITHRAILSGFPR